MNLALASRRDDAGFDHSMQRMPGTPVTALGASAAQAVAQPVVLYCVGAMKSGTSSVHAMLKQHPECHFNHVKELGFFSRDPKVENSLSYFTRRIKRLRQDVEAPDAPAWKRQALRQFVQARKLIRTQDLDGYRDFMFSGVSGRKIVADFGPGRRGLSYDCFADMVRFHDDVRFLYVMRDPVARLWSQARHLVRIKSLDAKPDADLADATKMVEAALMDESHQLWLTDYAAAVTAMLDVAPRNRIGLFVFEELFGSETGMTAVLDFLEIDPTIELNMGHVNKGLDAPLPQVLHDALRERLAPQYDYVKQVLGRTPQGWAA